MKRYISAVSMLLGLCSLLLAQASPDVSQLDSLLKDLGSNNPQQRQSAFFALIEMGRADEERPSAAIATGAVQNLESRYPSRQDAIRLGLIALLEKENAYFHQGVAPSTEEFYDYWGYVVESVSALQDERSVTALLDVLPTGNMALNALASFGDEVVEKVARRFPKATTDAIIGHSVVRLFAKMLSPENRSAIHNAASFQIIEDFLVRGSQAEDINTRLEAVDGLGKIGSERSLRVLQTLAESDTGTRTIDSTIHFPVREAAEKALAARNTH